MLFIISSITSLAFDSNNANALMYAQLQEAQLHNVKQWTTEPQGAERALCRRRARTATPSRTGAITPRPTKISRGTAPVHLTDAAWPLKLPAKPLPRRNCSPERSRSRPPAPIPTEATASAGVIETLGTMNGNLQHQLQRSDPMADTAPDTSHMNLPVSKQ